MKKIFKPDPFTKIKSRIHFEEFGGAHFERLAFAYVFNTLDDKIYDIEWRGQLGGDGGRDIWAQSKEDSHCYQCKNYQKMNVSVVYRDIDKLIKENAIPKKFILVSGGLVSNQARTKIEKYARAHGIEWVQIWTGPEFEERLYKYTPNVLKRFLDSEDFSERTIETEFSPIPSSIEEKPFGVTEFFVVAKKSYHVGLSYIPRTVSHINRKEPTNTTAYSLLEHSKSSRRVLLLSSAGIGKSIELKNLAEQFPKINSDVTPILIRLNHYAGEEIDFWLSK